MCPLLQMKIISTSGKRDFVLEKDNQRIFDVNYQNWFSNKAKSKLYGDDIEIKPRNIWASRFDIVKNKQNSGAITINWMGNTSIRTASEECKENTFSFKVKGIFERRFELSDADNKLILVIKPSMAWKKLNYNYDIEIKSAKYQEKLISGLLIYCGYCANHYMTMLAAC